MFKQSGKHNGLIFLHLMKVQFSYWSQNILNLFLGIGISLYTMVCWLAFKSNDPFLMISGISVGLIRNAMHIHLKTIADFRTKDWDSRLSLTAIPNWLSSVTTICFNILSTTVICTFMFAVAMIFFRDQRLLLTTANQGMIWVGLILCWFTSYAVASFIFIYIKSNKLSQMAGLLVYFTAMYFLGLGFPFERIISVRWLNYTLYIHPFRYVLNIVQAGFVNAPNFIYHKAGMDVNFGYGGQNWLPYFLAVVVIAFYGGLYEGRFYYLYSFHGRNKYGEFIVKESSARYISQLRRAKSLDEAKILHQQRIDFLKTQSDAAQKIIEQAEHESRLELGIKNRTSSGKKE